MQTVVWLGSMNEAPAAPPKLAMKQRCLSRFSKSVVTLCLTLAGLLWCHAQPQPGEGRSRDDRPRDGGRPVDGERGPGFGPPPGPDGGPPGPGGFGFGGPGGPPGGPQEEQKLVAKFDRDGDKILNSAERKAAWDFLKKEQAEGRGPRGPRGPRGGGNRPADPATPGRVIAPKDVKTFPNAPAYDPGIVRTFFLEFEDRDWEQQMAAFKNTDVEMPAKVTVDGRIYNQVGIHFRGMSSFMMVGEGKKRSLNLSFDFANKEQSFGGYRTLEFMNSHDDPSFLRTVLSCEIARAYLPAPKANFVHVVINGESWGIYVNAQPFNKDFLRDNFKTTKGARWKVPGSPRGQGSLSYLGEDIETYRKVYQIKTKDEAKSWKDLIRLCKVLNETPSDQLEKALSPLLDVDGALKFLAWENALVNNDGYWIRTSDYSLYEDVDGRFHVLIHDSNETFMRPESPRGPRDRGRRPGGATEGQPPAVPERPQVKGVELDPLAAANDASKPLLSKLLAVPAWREKYLGYVRAIATDWLDWNKLGPIAEKHHQLIATEVQLDTRKLSSSEAFVKNLSDEVKQEGGGPGGPGGFGGPGGPGGGRSVVGIKQFAVERRAFLLKQ